jgi:hypothetical protein
VRNVSWIGIGEGGDTRGESDGGADPAATRGLGQVEGVGARAGRAAKGVLLLVAEAAVAELFLLALFDAQAGVADEHAEALGVSVSECMYFGCLVLLETQ